MVSHKITFTPGFSLVIILACWCYFPVTSAGELNGTEWKVTPGDTLYSIGRSVYPDNAGKQSRLRQDIMILNPAVFGNDQINMNAGITLTLPRYVVDPQASGPASAPANPAPTPAPASNTVDSDRDKWIVRRGDTLYSIGRSLYPQDSRKQAFLRQDIVKLNRPVFAGGANNLAVGTALALPSYVSRQDITSAATRPAQSPAPAAAAVVVKPAAAAPAVVAKPAVTTTAARPVPEPAPPPTPVEATATTQSGSVNRRQASSEQPSSGDNFLVSLGLAYGGDELVEVDSGFDITGGSGINLRLGYQQLPAHGSGYRAALGLQYHTVKDASLQDTYLQLAYQYHANSLVYGIGLVAHSGGDLEDVGIDIEFDAANGLLLYLEETGDGTLAGWGLSLTSLELEEKDSGDTVDASHAEVYYSWNF